MLWEFSSSIASAVSHMRFDLPFALSAYLFVLSFQHPWIIVHIFITGDIPSLRSRLPGRFNGVA